jgi:hypothetical protein
MPAFYYDISEHPFLSRQAKALGPKRLAAEQRVAERLLELAGTTFADEDKDVAQDYVAMQVSIQVARDPRSYVATTIGKGSRTITYREGTPIHPLAEDGVQKLLAKLEPAAGETDSGFRIIKSFR